MRKRGTFWGVALALGVTTFICTWRVYHTDLPTFIETDTDHLVGAFHLHTDLSHDSQIPQAAYVQAAQALGLDFIVVTDHNAQGASSGPSDAVATIASAELSTSFGHVVGLGTRALVSAEARRDVAVLDAIKSQNGTAIIAHPTDGKRPWTGPYPTHGGLEIANWSSSVRRQSRRIGPMMPLAALAWFVNTPLALAQAYDRDDAALALWDTPEHAALAGFCAIDAHGWIDPRDNLKGWQLVLSGVLRGATTGHAQAHNDEIVEALRGGHFFCSAGLFGRAPMLTFAALHNAQLRASHGDRIAQQDVDALAVQVPSVAHSTTRLVVRRDGDIVYDGGASRWRLDHPQAGIYRIEVWALLPQLIGPARAVPILYSNTITVTA